MIPDSGIPDPVRVAGRDLIPFLSHLRLKIEFVNP